MALLAGFPMVANGVHGGTTGAVDSIGAKLLVMGGVCYTGITANLTPADSKSNAWTALTAYSSGSGEKFRLWYVDSATPSVGASHTFEALGALTYSAMMVWAFDDNVAANPFDTGQESGNNGTSTSFQPAASVTPSADGAVILVGVGLEADAGGTPTVNSSFISPVPAYQAITGNAGIAGSYLIQGAAAAVQPTISWPNTVGNAGGIAVFKLATGGGQPMSRRLGAVPFVGGQGVLGKGHGHGGGRMYGRSTSGRVIVPAWIVDEQRRAA